MILPRFSTRFAVIAAGALALLVAPLMPGASAMPRSATPAASEAALPVVNVAQSRKPKPEFMRKKVRLNTDEKPGTIIIDTSTKYLYYVEGNNRATRYGVGVGRDGFGWSGTVKVGRKAEWPDWRPPASMIARERRKGRKIPTYVKGGINNPLGARALYLYKGVEHLYSRAGVGSKVIVIGPSGKGSKRLYTDRGMDFFGTLFGG